MSDNYRRERDSDVGTRLTYFVIGATVGAVVALLFAPKSGRELREDLADATRKGVDRARETGSQLSTRAGELASSAREVVSARGERFSAAIEAGKQAYREEKRRTESSALTEETPAIESGQQP